MPAANQEHPQQQGAQVLPVQERVPLPVDGERPPWVPKQFPWPLPPTLYALDPTVLTGNMLLPNEQQSSGADQATDVPVRMLQRLLYLLCDENVANLSVLRTQLYPTVKPASPLMHKANRSLLLQQAHNGRGLLLDIVPNDGSHTSPAGHMRRLLACALSDINYLETV